MTALSFDIFYRDHGAERGLNDLGDKLDKTHGKFSAFKSMAAGLRRLREALARLQRLGPGQR